MEAFQHPLQTPIVSIISLVLTFLNLFWVCQQDSCLGLPTLTQVRAIFVLLAKHGMLLFLSQVLLLDENSVHPEFF